MVSPEPSEVSDEAGSEGAGTTGALDPVRSPADPWWIYAALAALTIAATVAYSWGIGHDGINVYYAGAVRSMASSWHDFVYGAFDRQGSISIDKLPGAFWLQVLSVKVFGFNESAMVLPEVVAGALTIPVLFRTVRRVAGARTALVAAVLFTFTPAALTEPRGNESDPWSLLLILLAVDAVLRAIAGPRRRERGLPGLRTTGGLRSLILAGVWFGLAFQTKMGEAWLPVPAVAVAYAIAGPKSFKNRALRLSAAAGVMIVVSFSWVTFVALTPAHDRPFTDGTTDNSPFSQIFGYNGFGRFAGGGTATYGLPSIAPPSPDASEYANDLVQFGHRTAIGSAASWNRLLTDDIGRCAGWLLPIALIAGVAILFVRRNEPRTDPLRAATIAFGLWLLTDTIVFSASGTLIPYYTTMLVPGIAVLCAIGLKTALTATPTRTARIATAAAIAAAVGWSAWLQSAGGALWSWAAVVLAAAAISALFIGRPQRTNRVLVAALAVTGAVVGPIAADAWLLHNGGGAWDAAYAAQGTTTHPDTDFFLTALPVYGASFHDGDGDLWKQMMANGRRNNALTAPNDAYVAVFSGSAASFQVTNGTDRVLVIGGYTGLLPKPSVDDIAALLRQNRIFTAIVPGPLDTRAADPRIQLIIHTCHPTAPLQQDDAQYIYICES